jgi:hypothetical protein
VAYHVILPQREIARAGCTDLHIVETMHVRKFGVSVAICWVEMHGALGALVRGRVERERCAAQSRAGKTRGR